MTPFVKTCRPGRARSQELHAYRVLVPQLQARGVRCASLLSVDGQTLHLERLPGRAGRLDDPPALFAAVGTALAELHRLVAPGDPMPLPEALSRRAHSWCERARNQQITGFDDLPARLAALPDLPRVWCHRDLQPRNWLVDGNTIALVDFEHCRPDHPVTDFVRLEARGWGSGQRDAFYEGYGERPCPQTLAAMLSLYALQTLTWAAEHADPELTTIGRYAAERARMLG